MLQINPPKSSFNFSEINTKAKRALPDTDKKEVIGLYDSYSEENFSSFQVTNHQNRILNLHTYRENGKNLEDLAKPRAILIQCHGLFAHQNTQAIIAKKFSEMGITTLGFDFRGHGKSEGKRGLVEGCDIYTRDLIEFTKLIDKIYDKQIPRFFLGLSLGGNVGFQIGIKLPEYFKGIMLLAPALQPHEKLSWLLRINRFFSCICTCAMPAPRPKRPEATSNLLVHETWNKDPLTVKTPIYLKTFANIEKGFDFCKANYKKFNVPFVVVVGGVDKLVDVKACVDLYEESEVKRKALLYGPDMWHVVQFEKEFLEIFNFLEKWVGEMIEPINNEIQPNEVQIELK